MEIHNPATVADISRESAAPCIEYRSAFLYIGISSFLLYGLLVLRLRKFSTGAYWSVSNGT